MGGNLILKYVIQKEFHVITYFSIVGNPIRRFKGNAHVILFIFQHKNELLFVAY